MSIFGKIKDAIFGRKDRRTGQSPANPRGNGRRAPGGHHHRNRATAPAPTTQPTEQVDVEQVLKDIAASKGNPDLNYKTSIVDLMKLLGLDSSLDNRKELATELGYTGDKDGSAEMNIWLHKAVMRELAKNGGKVPASMTD